MFFHDRGEAPPERPADPEVRRANLRRIGRLFRPYWRRLSLLLGLIVVSAGLGVVPAFLLRRVLIAIEAHDTRAVSLNSAGMIVIAIVVGILGVIQTLLSNQVGQRVMHDLRAAVFRHLQRLSLAFFTRTRTGEVQSRINNDIGGDPERRHEHRDEHRLEPDDGRRDDDRACSSSAGSSRCSRSR